LIKYRKGLGKATFCCFLDLRRAYDTVWREGLWEKLREIGVHGVFLSAITGLYREVRCCVQINGARSDWFQVEQGLRQGCVLSPLLFLIFINGMIRDLKDTRVGVSIRRRKLNNFCFADDAVLVAESRRDLQVLLNAAEKYANSWKLSFNVSKCKVMVFNRKAASPALLLDGKGLEEVKQYKYLGVWFDGRVSWKLHKTTVLDKARRRAYMMLGFGVCKALPIRTCLKLWEILVRPILEYAAEVWCDGIWEEAERLQREVGKVFLGLPVNTANEVVLGELGWWELRARRDKAKLKMLKRLSDRAKDDYCRFLTESKDSAWVQEVESLLADTGFSREVMRASDVESWRKMLTVKTHLAEQSDWRSRMKRKAKLRTYRIIKRDLELEPYLEMKDLKSRRTLSLLRSGSNFLRIESGRWTGQDIEERKCSWCDAVEDEAHFTLDCDLFVTPRESCLGSLVVPVFSGRTEKLAWFLGGFARTPRDKGQALAVMSEFFLCSRRIWGKYKDLEQDWLRAEG